MDPAGGRQSERSSLALGGTATAFLSELPAPIQPTHGARRGSTGTQPRREPHPRPARGGGQHEEVRGRLLPRVGPELPPVPPPAPAGAEDRGAAAMGCGRAVCVLLAAALLPARAFPQTNIKISQGE